jgi:hypothetical protein
MPSSSQYNLDVYAQTSADIDIYAAAMAAIGRVFVIGFGQTTDK